MTAFVVFVLVLIVTLCYASIAEWLVHRYWMHRPFWFFKWKFDYPFHAHTVIHHQIFGGDESYKLDTHPPHLQEEHAKTIPMAWWNGPALIGIASLPFILLSIFHPSWSLVCVVVAIISLYYLAYEFSHYCMHDEKKIHWFERVFPQIYVVRRWVQSTRLFPWLDKRHDLHHIDMRTNYNVVLPFADWLFGTRHPDDPRLLSW